MDTKEGGATKRELSDQEKAFVELTAKPNAAQPLPPKTYEEFYGPRELRLPLSSACANNRSFRSGAALYDTTGPAYDQGMAGYANPVQVSEGLLNRQFARAFIIGSDCTGEDKRIVLVSVDLGLTFHAIKQGVIDLIKLDKDLAGHYDYDNIMVTPTRAVAPLGSKGGETSTTSAPTRLSPWRPRTIFWASKVVNPPISGVPVPGA